MKILAFETSCDDTSIAIFEDNQLIAMDTKSQISIHNVTNWVVPEVAAREHANSIFEVLKNVLSQASLSLDDIDYIAVTVEPWLLPSLLTGIAVANTLSTTLKIPIIPIHHIEAHIFSNYLERKEDDIVLPALCLTASWGHTEIYHLPDMFTFAKIWWTQDDAAWEAFDKVSKMMWLGYPGWPIINKLADEWQVKLWNQKSKNIFPRVWLEKWKIEFSFSGLKTAVKREIEKRESQNVDGKLLLDDEQEIAYEFSQAILEVLAEKFVNAAVEYNAQTLMLAGWVSANENLKNLIWEKLWKSILKNSQLVSPIKKIYCMDNAAMIGICAYYRIKYSKFEKYIGALKI